MKANDIYKVEALMETRYRLRQAYLVLENKASVQPFYDFHTSLRSFEVNDLDKDLMDSLLKKLSEVLSEQRRRLDAKIESYGVSL